MWCCRISAFSRCLLVSFIFCGHIKSGSTSTRQSYSRITFSTKPTGREPCYICDSNSTCSFIIRAIACKNCRTGVLSDEVASNSIESAWAPSCSTEAAILRTEWTSKYCKWCKAGGIVVFYCEKMWIIWDLLLTRARKWLVFLNRVKACVMIFNHMLMH